MAGSRAAGCALPRRTPLGMLSRPTPKGHEAIGRTTCRITARTGGRRQTPDGPGSMTWIACLLGTCLGDGDRLRRGPTLGYRRRHGDYIAYTGHRHGRTELEGEAALVVRRDEALHNHHGHQAAIRHDDDADRRARGGGPGDHERRAHLRPVGGSLNRQHRPRYRDHRPVGPGTRRGLGLQRRLGAPDVDLVLALDDLVRPRPVVLWGAVG